jgi:hypothetical protein
VRDQLRQRERKKKRRRVFEKEERKKIVGMKRRMVGVSWIFRSTRERTGPFLGFVACPPNTKKKEKNLLKKFGKFGFLLF